MKDNPEKMKMSESRAYNMGVIAGCCQAVMKAHLGKEYALNPYSQLVASAPTNSTYFARLMEVKSRYEHHVDGKRASRIAELYDAAIKTITDMRDEASFGSLSGAEQVHYWLGVNTAERKINGKE